MKIDSYERVLNSIKHDQFVVYGAGGHANKFIRIVEYLGYLDNYLFSAVSKKGHNDCEEISLIDEVERDYTIMVAAHDKNSQEMECTLNKLGFVDYHMIYPHLIELGCGLPYQKDVDIDVGTILKGCRYGNYISIIYLAIDDIVNNNMIGKDLYYRLMCAYSQPSTAEKRLDSLIDRVKLYNEHGYEKYSIKINPKEGFVLDGAHRLSLARFFGIETIKADLYSVSFEHYNNIFGGERNGLSREELEAYFLPSECELIDKNRIRIFGQKAE